MSIIHTHISSNYMSMRMSFMIIIIERVFNLEVNQNMTANNDVKITGFYFLKEWFLTAFRNEHNFLMGFEITFYILWK